MSAEPAAPNTERVAADLGVDADLLERFAEEHPDPTAPIMIGWATTRGELRVHPERCRDDVAAWLEAREDRRHNPDPLPLKERLYASAVRSIRGGEP